MYTKESDLQRDCEGFLKELQKLKYQIEFIHLKNLNRYGKRIVNQGKSKDDQPDLFIFLPKGKAIMVELKSVTGKLSSGQRTKLHKYYFMGYPVYAVKGSLDRFKRIIMKELEKEV